MVCEFAYNRVHTIAAELEFQQMRPWTSLQWQSPWLFYKQTSDAMYLANSGAANKKQLCVSEAEHVILTGCVNCFEKPENS